jgi:hypothetical protein
MVKQVACYSPGGATTLKKAFRANPQAPITYTIEEALAPYIDGNVIKLLRTPNQSQEHLRRAVYIPIPIPSLPVGN